MENSETVTAAFNLSGRVAVVTGAGSGLGQASAEILAGAGATVICGDINDERAQETATSIRSTGGSAESVGVDVSDEHAHHLLLDAALSHGRLDIWVNSAGIMAEAQVLDLKAADLDALMNVNVKGTLFGAQTAGRYMAEHGGGSIINMASGAMQMPSPDIAAYAMTKASVVQMTRIMALEIGKRGVRVNAVAPGFVPTSMTSRYYQRPDGSIDEEMKAAVLTPMAKMAPLKRVGEPRDIGFAVLYLASDASSFLTGQVLSPNGGVVMV